jgi:hypothetical protein
MTPDRVAASIASFDFLYLSELERARVVAPTVGANDARVRNEMSSRRVCESAGGTYSGLTCYPYVPKGAEQMCLANGGVYLTSEDYCDAPIR